MAFVKSFSQIEIPENKELGGKAYSLVVLTKNGFKIPRGFVLTANAFFEYLQYNSLLSEIEKLASEINESNFEVNSQRIRELIIGGKLPQEIIVEVEENLQRMGAQYVSIRSSALSEDSLKASFAGLYDTFLNVKINSAVVLESIKKCWASLFNARAVIYRIKKRMPHLEGMAIIIQQMMAAGKSGITFTIHPADEKSLLVEASYGIGDIIVSGKTQPDDYTVDRKTLKIVERKIGKKNRMSIAANEGVAIIDVEKELVPKQVLSDNEVKEVASICLMVEKLFNYPQDIEWCIDGDELWLLQSRAITGVIK